MRMVTMSVTQGHHQCVSARSSAGRLHFLPHHAQTSCPGWSEEKQLVFEEERLTLPLGRFQLAHRVGPWLLSHAGIHPALVSDPATVDEQIRHAYRVMNAGLPTPLLGVGRGRGGNDKIGGITWLDFTREFMPVNGIYQIVGHTPAPGVARGKHIDETGRRVDSETYDMGVTTGSLLQPSTGARSVNYCIDSDLTIVALLDDRGVQFLATGVTE